jgi:arylsulfatase A
LTGQLGTSAGREVEYFFCNTELQAVRKGRWKLHVPHAYDHITEPARDGGKTAKTESRRLDLSLFDLDTDPGEAKNVAAEHPATVQELQQLITTFAADMQQTKRPGAVAKP